MNTRSINAYFSKTTHAAPLAVFRILFGILMAGSMIRFAAKGWIREMYIDPVFFFSYSGFEWVKPMGEWTYLIFLVCGLSALFVSLGYKYRIAIISFFLSFTYIELMDKTTYLNHYYFISILSFLMIFLPAHVTFSVDAWRDKKLRSAKVPAWTIHSIKMLLCMVYFYAGLAKLNSDWLLHAMPLKIWLSANHTIPILGDLFQQEWSYYLMSWAGAVYDLSIPFLLLMKRTRVLAFGLVVIFHGLTSLLFPIGMFPYIMIVSALIFFDSSVHQKILNRISHILNIQKERFENGKIYEFSSSLTRNIAIGTVGLFFIIQILVPFRYLLYPDELFWTEEGYRFSWRVMLMEKAGRANFKVVDPVSIQSFIVDNMEFLTDFQEKEMATQPDFILEYAHFLEKHYQEKGITDPEIYVESYITLNGRRSQRYVNPDIDLTRTDSIQNQRDILLPFEDKILGL